MVKKFLLLGVFTIALGCSDKDSPTSNTGADCGARNYGTITLTSNSKNKYSVTISGSSSSSFDMNGKETKSYDATPGSVKIYVKQLEGYALYPTTKETTIKVEQCKSYSWSFPD